jgi:hypothetical protein
MDRKTLQSKVTPFAILVFFTSELLVFLLGSSLTGPTRIAGPFNLGPSSQSLLMATLLFTTLSGGTMLVLRRKLYVQASVLVTGLLILIPTLVSWKESPGYDVLFDDDRYISAPGWAYGVVFSISILHVLAALYFANKRFRER